MTKGEIINCLRTKDKNKKIYHSGVPDEYKRNKDIINEERNLGMRKIDKIGFDVINQVYFVHESVLAIKEYSKEEFWEYSLRVFDDFNDYYNYLNGEIYDNACYFQCDLSKIKKEVDKSRMIERKSFITECIDDYTAIPRKDEILEYKYGEKRKQKVKKWVDKFLACTTVEELQKTISNYHKTKLNQKDRIKVDFFLWNYIFYDLHDRKRFDVIMQYISTEGYIWNGLVRPLCHVYNPEEVLRKYNYPLGSEQECTENKKHLRKYIDSLSDRSKKVSETKVYYDMQTHYYCEEKSYGVYRYFETFEELLSYRNNDLSNADLTKDIQLVYDFEKCKTNKNTKLPIWDTSELKYVVKKDYSDGKFRVFQGWYNKNDAVVKCYTHYFEYFFDFAAFLKGDFSGADLLFCDGLKNLIDVSNMDFTDALIRSGTCDALGIEYDRYFIGSNKVKSFEEAEENEKSTAPVLRASREPANPFTEGTSEYYEYYWNKNIISYVSDLHLLHRLDYFKPKSVADVIYILSTIVQQLVDETESTLLIGGDVASNFALFELFIRLLRYELNRKKRYTKVIFALGNHELWDFPSLSFDSIVAKYKSLISGYGMYLLQNDILYQDTNGNMCQITRDEIVSSSEIEIRNKLRETRMILFGGLAFSGYNIKFNANNGIYRKTISRDEEIKQSKDFNALYNKVTKIIPDRKLIILTHTPMEDWCEKADYHKEYIYVSGHTHRNQFYDDGSLRIYADNQIGYYNNCPHLKCFEVDNEYDYFSDYEDGIHKITEDDYKRFYRGKNIMIRFNRKVNALYMLKKKGYYCFISQAKSGVLTILNGGSLKRLDKHDIKYYYDNMDGVIATIKTPLDKYTSIQEKIAAEIRKIGGEGKIHGCIIDIDWYNHVYVNPVDMKITAYWASDIINKEVYPDVPALLEKECPSMYVKYKKLLKGSSENLQTISKGTGQNIAVLPQIYLDTDIYKASREIKKMQKLSSNILSVWYDVDNSTKMLELRDEKR